MRGLILKVAVSLAASAVLWSWSGSAAAVSNWSSPPTLNFIINPATIKLGDSATLSWSSTNATSCTASGSWTGTKATASNARTPATVSPTKLGTYTYNLSCTGSGGTVKKTVTLQVMTFLDLQIKAAKQTAYNTDPASSCGVIDQNKTGSDDGFYWEIGDKNGIIADTAQGLSAAGSVQPSGVGAYNYTRTTQLLVASASKWLYGTYVAETKAQLKNGVWQFPSTYIPFLNFTSGYDNMADNCPYTVTPTVGDCLNVYDGGIPNVKNGARTLADIGLFDYNSGHLQVFEGGADRSIAGVMNGADNNVIALGNEITTALTAKGVTINLTYTAPIPAGGAETTPGDYAAFLQGLLRTTNPMVMRSLLRPTSSDPYAVCTNPYDKTCVDKNGNPLAIFAPLPGSVSWHYSITHWIEDDPDTGDGAYSSPGKYGFYPWIDSTKTYYGIVARYDPTGTSDINAPFYQSVVCGQAIRKAFMTGAVQP